MGAILMARLLPRWRLGLALIVGSFWSAACLTTSTLGLDCTQDDQCARGEYCQVAASANLGACAALGPDEGSGADSAGDDDDDGGGGGTSVGVRCVPGRSGCLEGQKCVGTRVAQSGELAFSCVAASVDTPMGKPCQRDDQCREGALCAANSGICDDSGQSCCTPLCWTNEDSECAPQARNVEFSGVCSSVWQGPAPRPELNALGTCQVGSYRGCDPRIDNCSSRTTCQFGRFTDLSDPVFICVPELEPGLGELADPCEYSSEVGEYICQPGLVCAASRECSAICDAPPEVSSCSIAGETGRCDRFWPSGGAPAGLESIGACVP